MKSKSPSIRLSSILVAAFISTGFAEQVPAQNLSSASIQSSVDDEVSYWTSSNNDEYILDVNDRFLLRGWSLGSGHGRISVSVLDGFRKRNGDCRTAHKVRLGRPQPTWLTIEYHTNLKNNNTDVEIIRTADFFGHAKKYSFTLENNGKFSLVSPGVVISFHGNDIIYAQSAGPIGPYNSHNLVISYDIANSSTIGSVALDKSEWKFNSTNLLTVGKEISINGYIIHDRGGVGRVINSNAILEKVMPINYLIDGYISKSLIDSLAVKEKHYLVVPDTNCEPVECIPSKQPDPCQIIFGIACICHVSTGSPFGGVCLI